MGRDPEIYMLVMLCQNFVNFAYKFYRVDFAYVDCEMIPAVH